MTLRLNGSTSGYTEIDAPAVAGNNTITFPTTSGTAVVNGANSAIVSGTAVASTSGTSINFTGIPSWVKRVTVMFSGVSTTGSSNKLVQIGSGSIVSAGYDSSAGNLASATSSNTTSTQGFLVYSIGSTDTVSGVLEVRNISGNSWVANSVIKTTANSVSYSAGDVTLSGTLDRIRITTVNGTDTFDAGSINIMYE